MPDPEAARDEGICSTSSPLCFSFRLSALALAFPLSNTTRPLFACPCWDVPSDEELLPSLECRARFLVVAAAAAWTALGMDVLVARREEDDEEATEPPPAVVVVVESRRGPAACMPLITSNSCSGFVLWGTAELSGLAATIGLLDGLDLVSEGRGRDLGGLEEGLEDEEDLEEEDEGLDIDEEADEDGLNNEEEADEDGLEDPNDVEGPWSFVLRRENSGIWSNDG